MVKVVKVIRGIINNGMIITGIQNHPQLLWKPLQLMFKGEVNLCIILVHFVKVSILMMSVINIESCLIVSNDCSVKDDVFFV